MITKESLKAKVGTKYASKGLADTALGKLTDIVYNQLTEETTNEEIETAIAGLEPYASLLQSEVERVRTAKTQESKKRKEAGEQEGASQEDNTQSKKQVENDDETPPKWAKGILDRLDRIEGDKVVGSRKSQLETALNGLTDLQRKPYAHLNLEAYTDEDFAAKMAEINTEAEEFRTENAKQGGGFTPPRHKSKPKAEEKSSEEDLEAVRRRTGIRRKPKTE